MNRDRFLTFHGMDARRWAARFGLEQFTVPCSACGAERTTTIPIACGELRGFIAPWCDCGSDDRPYCFVNLGASPFSRVRRRATPPVASAKSRRDRGHLHVTLLRRRLLD